MSAQHSDTSPGDGEGPLAHAARASSEAEYLEGLGDRHRIAWERASGARPEPTSKRLLVALSHTIEKAVMAAAPEDPTVVVALFQRLEFFDRERAVYERMAAAGIRVIVGFVEGTLDAWETEPAGLSTVLLAPDEALAEEWSVVAVGPRAGAFLVATDQHRFDPTERDYEASRQFVGRWGYARTPAAAELARLRFSLGDRLDTDARRTVDEVLARTMPAGAQVAASAGTPGETWATTSLYHLVDRMKTATAGTREMREQLADAHRAVAARAASTVDPHSGLPTADFLERWASPAGETALPIGVALFDVTALESPELQHDHRAAYHAAHHVAAAMTLPLGPVDAVVRLSARGFLVVVPGASPRHLAGICDEIADQLELASHGYPAVSLRATLATVVTSSRPLPVDALHEALERLRAGGGAGPVDAGHTVGGDRITVASTALHGEPFDDGGQHADHGYGPLAAVAPLSDDGPGLPLPRRQAQATLNQLEHPEGSADVFTDLSQRPPGGMGSGQL